MKAPAKNFIRELQSKDIKFDSKEIDGGKDWVMVRFTGKNCPSITTQFFFDAVGIADEPAYEVVRATRYCCYDAGDASGGAAFGCAESLVAAP